MFCRYFVAAGAACLTTYGPATQSAETTNLDEVVVSATVFREQQLLDVPASVTALTAQTLKDSGQQHFQDVFAQVPNLNWSAGSSRPRYFQIRGIGEREQYQGAPNYSVGFLIDDIDFSGIGMAATLFDVDQIEVLRGPQGTRYGANALAGLIAVRSADPNSEFAGYVSSDVGNYDTLGAGLVMTGPADEWNSAWRLAVKKQRSDGFRDNVFLGRDDTNDRDETTARGKWRWFAGERSQLDVTILHVNLDNGYDAFSIDNSRNTLSDKPGEDSLRANAGALKWQSELESGATFMTVASLVNSAGVHAYDGDWGNDVSWIPFVYDYNYRADRARREQSLEARITSSPFVGNGIAWLGGVYVSNLRESINETSRGDFADPDGYTESKDEFLDSLFHAKTAAIFGQLDGRFLDKWNWLLGARAEQRKSDYSDDGNWDDEIGRSTHDEAKDNMFGGSASLTYAVANRARLYASVSRGYKAGGFNLGSTSTTQPTFEPEFLWNYELGAKTDWLDRSLYADVTFFYMQRKDMQVRTGQQTTPGDPDSYVFVTTNVASGHNYGAEVSLRWVPVASLELGGQIGCLRTYQSSTVDGDGNSVPSRAQAHAPEYQVQLNATYRHPVGVMARVDFSAVDEFYFDVASDHDQRSRPYRLTNIKIGYEADRWQVYAWTRNLFDEEYATRGFYFGNEPPNWEDKLYTQNGDPREFGLSAEWHF